MRATKLSLRPTLVVVLLARGHSLLIPNSPQPRDQRACGMSLLSASIFRSIKIRDPRVPPGLGRVKGQKNSKEAEGSRASESKSLL